MSVTQVAKLRDERGKLLFPGNIYTVQRRLKRLYDLKMLKRTRIDDGSYIYYLKKHEQIDHILGVGWCRLWIENKFLKHGEKLHEWRQEEDYGSIRPDATFVVWDGWNQVYLRYFLEFETGSKLCTKIADYNRFYEQNKWQGYWWNKLNEGFPTILIVGSRKVNFDENIHGLDIKAIEKNIVWRDLGL